VTAYNLRACNHPPVHDSPRLRTWFSTDKQPLRRGGEPHTKSALTSFLYDFGLVYSEAIDLCHQKKRTAVATKSFAGATHSGGIERSEKISFSKTGGAGQHPHETSTPQFNRMKYTNTGTKLSAAMKGNKSNYTQNKHIQRRQMDACIG
jgi:hypothetical protein